MHPLTQNVGNGELPNARNMHVACDINNGRIEYAYKIREGPSGKSYGEEAAKDVGLQCEEIEKIIKTRAKKEGFGILLRK